MSSYLVIPENPGSTDFNNKYFMIFKVTGSDYKHDNLTSYVTIRFTNVSGNCDIENLDYYLVPYGETSEYNAYSEHINHYEKNCRIENKTQK